METLKYKKIVPCLDYKDGRVVKGVHFVDIIDAGDPVENAVFYEKEGADELAFLDISATLQQRKTAIKDIERITKAIKIPLTVGGGIASIGDIERILQAGASKVSINSQSYKQPSLIKEAVAKFGSNKIVVAIDAKLIGNKYNLFINGGTLDTGEDAVLWAKKMEDYGAGELLPTSIDRDGAKNGYDLVLLKAITDKASIPVTASGGAGKLEDFLFAFTKGGVAAALAASLFHFREVQIPVLKKYLSENGIKVKL